MLPPGAERPRFHFSRHISAGISLVALLACLAFGVKWGSPNSMPEMDELYAIPSAVTFSLCLLLIVRITVPWLISDLISPFLLSGWLEGPDRLLDFHSQPRLCLEGLLGAASSCVDAKIAKGSLVLTARGCVAEGLHRLQMITVL